jgi:uncharacterized protein YndB with AHSA1/START domain
MKKTLPILLLFVTTFALAQERMISFTVDVNAPADTIWTRWTTPAGISRFFAAQSRIELQTLGRLDFYMKPSAPEGQRGAENNRVLAWQEKKMLSFTWDAPPNYPDIRKQRTVVIVRMNELSPQKTNVSITHVGFGTGKDWDEVYGYFNRAWSEFVLPNLKYSCEHPGVNLSNMPTGLPAAKKL